MITKDQAITPTSADYAMGYAEGFNDACKPPAPDCRTCADYDRLDGCLRAPRYGVCTNGDKYQAAPAVVLWRTE